MKGHSAAVTCVSFDAQEEVVAAGAASGTLKLWDLHEARCVRSLTGHRSEALSLAFHPFGDFLASGSLDTNMKGASFCCAQPARKRAAAASRQATQACKQAGATRGVQHTIARAQVSAYFRCFVGLTPFCGAAN